MDLKDFATHTHNADGSPRAKHKYPFLHRMPAIWLSTAHSLGGMTLQVAIAIWLAHKVSRGDTIRLTSKWLEWFPMSREAKARGLSLLQDAGLIEYHVPTGCAPVVTVLDIPEAATK